MSTSSRSLAVPVAGLSVGVLAFTLSLGRKSDPSVATSFDPPTYATVKGGASKAGETAPSVDFGDTVRKVVQRLHAAAPVRIAPLIVMVADPVDTGLDWAHDQHVKAVRRAYEAGGFTLVQHEVPWAPGPNGPTVTNPERPGLLVFNNQGRGIVAPVFLVAESHTAALSEQDVKSLEVALRHCLQFQPGFGSLYTRHDLRIVGPVFSGSRRALVFALGRSWEMVQRGMISIRFGRHLANPLLHVDMVGGSATIDTLASDIADAASKAGGLDLRFHSVLMGDGEYEAAVERIAKHLGYEPEQCAVLSETSTQYAQTAVGIGKATESQLSKSPSAGNGSNFYGRCRRFTIPSQVTHLRSDYSDRWDRETPNKVKQSIRLGLLDASNVKLAPSPVSPLTNAVVDQRLTWLLQSLEDSGSKMAIVLATDVRDKILLGREIARQAPDVQLVTTESNLLYLRSEIASAQRGMLVVGSTSLVAHRPGCIDDGAATSAFASDAEVGVCAAVVEHIAVTLAGDRTDMDSGVLDTRKEVVGLRRAAGIPEDLGRGVCVTCVGATRMLPVAFVPKMLDSPQTPHAPATVDTGSHDRPDWRIAAGIALLALGLAVACHRLLVHNLPEPRLLAASTVPSLPRRQLVNFGLESIVQRRDHACAKAALLSMVWCAAYSLLVFGVLFAALGFVVVCSSGVQYAWLLVTTSLLALAVAVRVLRSNVVCFVRRFAIAGRTLTHSNPGRGRIRVCAFLIGAGIGALALCLLTAMLVMVGLWAIADNACGIDPWVVERVRLAFDFVSPVVPTMGLGLLLVYWVAVQVRRVRRSRVTLPYDLALAAPLRRIRWGRGDPSEVRDILLGGYVQPHILVGLSVAALVAAFSLDSHTTIESLNGLGRSSGAQRLMDDPFGAFYRFGLVFLMCAGVVGSARLLAIWSVVGRHVRWFDEPMLAALRRMADRPTAVIETDLAASPLLVNHRHEIQQAWKGLASWAGDAPFQVRQLLAGPISITTRASVLAQLATLYGDRVRPWRVERLAAVSGSVRRTV